MKEVVIYQAPPEKKSSKTSRLKIKKTLRRTGNILIFIAFFGLTFTFFPVLKAEFFYKFKKTQQVYFGDLLKKSPLSQEITAPDPYFSLVIPKIEARAKVFPNVDAGNPKAYLPILKKGVAHAKGTVFPGMKGTILLFAHSTDSPFNIARYNALFYLLKELEPGDEIIVFFLNKRFNYKVVEKKIVSRQETDFFSQKEEEVLVLQTCWPPGTTQKALLLFAKRN